MVRSMIMISEFEESKKYYLTLSYNDIRKAVEFAQDFIWEMTSQPYDDISDLVWKYLYSKFDIIKKD